MKSLIFFMPRSRSMQVKFKKLFYFKSKLFQYIIDRTKGTSGNLNKKRFYASKKRVSVAQEKKVFSTSEYEYQQEFLNKVIDIIANNLSENLDVVYISKELNLTRHTFLRRIKKYSGYTAIGFVKEYRLKEAAKFLEIKKNLSVKEIAHMVGYNSLPYFCSEFKKRFHMSPKKYQENIR